MIIECDQIATDATFELMRRFLSDEQSQSVLIKLCDLSRERN